MNAIIMRSCSVVLQCLLAGTNNPQVPPSSSSPDPPKRGRGRPRGSSKTAAASSAAAAASVHPAEANADIEGQHGAGLEPAGPAQDGANVRGPQTRRRRNTSGSQATDAAAIGANNGSTDAETAAATAAVPRDVPASKRGSKVQSEAAKSSRRGRSRSASSVSQLKQVRRSLETTDSLVSGVACMCSQGFFYGLEHSGS